MGTVLRERIPARVWRMDGSSGAQTGADLTARRFMGVLCHPVPRSEMLRRWGVDARGCKIMVDWPAGGEDKVVRPGDVLEVQGRRHMVRGVKPCSHLNLELYVDE